MRKTLFFMILPLLALSACATYKLEDLAADQKKLQSAYQRIDPDLATYCAPHQYAMFVANLSFLMEEADEEDVKDTRVFFSRAHAGAKQSERLISKCQDPDRDGLLGEQDLCPLAAEDRDQYRDDDGCPDFDDDGDGIPDLQDKCPDEKETINDFQDEDGCPDQKP